MKPFADITTKWKRFGVGTLTDHQYQVSLLPQDATTLQQLCERYPRMTQAEIIRDLLGAALRDLEQSLPYQPGEEVIALDEMGDEIYADDGLTPRFLALTKHYQQLLRLDCDAIPSA